MSEESGAVPRRKWWTWLLLLGVHTMVLVVLLCADETVYKVFHELKTLWDSKKFILFRLLTDDDTWEFFASFGLWMAAVALAVLVGSLDNRWKRLVPILAVGVIVASALTSVLSKTVGRARPGRTAGKSVFLPFGEAWKSGGSCAFPSGHATFAAAMAAFLSAAYPRTKGFAWVMAVGCGISRIYFTKHFPADIYAGFLMGHYVMMGTWHAFERAKGMRESG
jgi:membrane-associated phospholipid phosphatase